MLYYQENRVSAVFSFLFLAFDSFFLMLKFSKRTNITHILDANLRFQGNFSMNYGFFFCDVTDDISKKIFVMVE